MWRASSPRGFRRQFGRSMSRSSSPTALSWRPTQTEACVAWSIADAVRSLASSSRTSIPPGSARSAQNGLERCPTGGTGSAKDADTSRRSSSSARCSIRDGYRCDHCGILILNREALFSLTYHHVRKRPGRRQPHRWVLLPEEMPAGVHELIFHEDCFFRNSTSILLELFGTKLPEAPRMTRRARSRKR